MHAVRHAGLCHVPSATILQSSVNPLVDFRLLSDKTLCSAPPRGWSTIEPACKHNPTYLTYLHSPILSIIQIYTSFPPAMQAVVTLTEALAMEQAKAADDLLAQVGALLLNVADLCAKKSK